MTTLGAAWSVAVAAIAAAGLVGPFLTPSSRHTREGLDAYGKGEWTESMTRFGEALEGAEDPGVIDFNLGAAAYRSGDLETAVRQFSAARRSDAVPPGAADYNLGNVLSEAGQLEEALGAYRAALRADPGNEDARYNYEVTLQRLQSGEQQSEESGDDRERNEEQQQDQQSSEDGGGDGGQQEQDEQEQQQQSQQEQPSEDQQGEQQQPQPQEGEQQEPQPGEEQQPVPMDPEQLLSPEEAARLLNAITPEERELIQARLKASKQRRAEKDW